MFLKGEARRDRGHSLSCGTGGVGCHWGQDVWTLWLGAWWYFRTEGAVEDEHCLIHVLLRDTLHRG